MSAGASSSTEPEVRPDHVKSLVRNVAALLAAYVLPKAFVFASVVVAARLLGTSDFGDYGTAGAFATILSILVSLGMQPLLVRDIARDPAAAPRLLRAAHIVKLLAGAVMFAALLLLARALNFAPEVTGVALVLAMGYWLATLGDNFNAYFQGVERMGVCSEASTLFGLVSAIAGVALAVSTRSMLWFAAAFPLGQVASLLWLVSRAPAAVRRGAEARPDDVARLAKTALPFALAFALLTVHYKMDLLILRSFRPAEEVGLYSAAYRFVDVFHALVLVGVGAVFPRLSRAAGLAIANGSRWAARRSAELVLLVAVPAAAGLWLLRAPLIGVFGPEFVGSIELLALLAPALPALALNLHGGYVLGAAGRMRSMAGLYAGSAGIKVALLLVATARWGALGAAGAVLIAEFILAGGFALVLGRVAHAAPGTRSVALALGAAVLALVSSATLVSLDAFVAAGAYTMAVAALYWGGGALSGRERRALRGALALRRVPAEGAT
jgi:O-antigen/teichoic acid export membrane protein